MYIRRAAYQSKPCVLVRLYRCNFVSVVPPTRLTIRTSCRFGGGAEAVDFHERLAERAVSHGLGPGWNSQFFPIRWIVEATVHYSSQLTGEDIYISA